MIIYNVLLIMFKDLTQKLLSVGKNQKFGFEEATSLAQQLRECIAHHDHLYYVASEPAISDTDYDYLFDLLRGIERQYAELIVPDSPTQRVARGLSGEFASIVHDVPMLSLDKAYTDEDLCDWDISCKKLTGLDALNYWIEPKLDGASISMIYENNLLTLAITRGDGSMGEDISNNIKTLKSVPLRADFGQYGITRAVVRGEAIISLSNFDKINENFAQNNEKKLANPRNAVSGGLRQKDSSKIGERRIEVFTYQIASALDADGNELLGKASRLMCQSETANLLRTLGFKTPAHHFDDVHICANIEEVLLACANWRQKRSKYNYETDGIVVKLDNISLHDKVGGTSHHPRWAIALKFDSRQAETVLERVEFQVGRTGVVTPVAKLRTVNLSGVNISNASMHNEDYIKQKDIRIGDTVVIERAGDVIPYIVEVLVDNRLGHELPVVFPENCPSCQSALVKPEEESAWRCVNADCPAQLEERVLHFVSKGAMDIEGLGTKIIADFFAKKIIQSIEDIYQLPYDRIRQMEGWKDKSVSNLRQNIELSKQQPLFRLLVGLGIREVGTTTAKVLAGLVKDIADFEEWTEDRLTEIPNIGAKMAKNIVDFFANEKNKALIADLRELGLNMLNPDADAPPKPEGILLDKTFLFTGTLPTLSREQAEELVTQNGGKVLSSVSSKLNYLVAGEKAGSKLAKAQKIGTVQIIDESAFLAMLEE